MSPKELEYVKDALGHEEFIKTECCNCGQKLTDSELKQLADQMSTKHQELFGKFYNLV
ncbi:hypothetical protein [Anaerolentibacter hominis]|uniref:hypothetical protein n=1 Tax=Anaerolentibacter hominis TaxID=3079009 RepID=UPI0031B853E3